MTDDTDKIMSFGRQAADLGDALWDAQREITKLKFERDELREELAALRLIAQNALDHGGDMELVYAPLYQQALEDIASEPQDDE